MRRPPANEIRQGAPRGSRPVKVMHVVYALRTGGIELGVIRLANALDTSRVVASICSCQPADAARTRLRDSVPVFEFARHSGQDPVFVGQLAKLLRRERPDIVHTHNWGTLCEGWVAARISGVPLVVHSEHGTLETRPRNLRVQRFLWRRLDRVLSVSSRLAERMARTVGFPLDKIQVIRDGVDTERFTPNRREAARRAFGFLTPSNVVIGAAGRLVPVKDHARLIHALELLAAEGHDFHAVIAGDGPLRQDLAALAARCGLGERVSFLGSRSDVEDVLAACDIFALSSVSEGLPLAVMEAMSTGLPVVATHVGGVDELVTDGCHGWLVRPSDTAALSSALRQLVTSENLRREMGAAGRRRIVRELSLQRTVAAYEGLYLDLAGRRMPAPFVHEGASQEVPVEPVPKRL